MQFVIITGNPIDGITIYGPFFSPEEAIEWAEENRGEIWWMTQLEHPKTEGE